MRRFNRVVTQRVGALNDRFLGLGRPLGEARMVWEVGTEGCEVRSLRSRLGLDSGHASRLLRTLEADGLVELEPSPADRRVRVARLTSRGLAERALLEERSDEVASSIARPADAGRAQRARGRYADGRAATDEGQRRAARGGSRRARCPALHPGLLRGDRPAVGLGLRPRHQPPRRAAGLRRPRRRLPGRLPPGRARGLRRRQASRRAASRRSSGCGWPSRCAGWAPAGAFSPSSSADARRHGSSAARLDTNRFLVEAISMYRSAGYVEVPPRSTTSPSPTTGSARNSERLRRPWTSSSS